MLQLQRVSSGYPDLPVLFDISFSVPAGELVSILGGNGAGKSTLLKTILGDVAVSEGEVVLGGERITRLPAHRRVAAGVSYSPEGRRVFPNLTVRENLVAGSHGVPSAELADQMAVVYELFPLLEERDRQRAGSLSGGEQQMLAIGRALMPRPKLLMVEEISLGLAPIVVNHLYVALRTLCERGLIVLVSEQFQRFETRYSDRWIVLERGTIVASGDRSDAHRLRAPAAG
jgi:branched-chain amino acid transport system ATP-binding protein